VDSLHELARWIVTEADTIVVPPRAARQARVLAAARADSARLAWATEVERAAVGGEPPRLVVDSLPALPADSVSGAVRSEGRLSGNVQRFVGRGSVTGDSIVARGNVVRHVRANYVVARTDTGVPRIVAGASLSKAETAGVDFDGADVRATDAGGRGSVQLAIHQEAINEYQAAAEFELNLDGNRLLYNSLHLRFDTTTWVAARPGRVLWGPDGIRIDQVDLRHGDAGRI